MRTLVACGAGVDSTVLAYILLRDTDEEIVLVYYREDRWDDHPSILKREEKAHIAIARWLTKNVRSCTALVRDTVDIKLDRDARYEVRKGFMLVHDTTFGGWGIERYAMHAAEAERLKADRIVLGINTWDTDTDFHPMYWLPVYRKRTSIPLELPFFEDPHDHWHEGPGLGRFEVQSFLPDDLFKRTTRCREKGGRPCGECQRCRINAFYDRHCRGKTRREIRAIDRKIEKRYCLGRWRSEANPLTYDPARKYDLR